MISMRLFSRPTLQEEEEDEEELSLLSSPRPSVFVSRNKSGTFYSRQKVGNMGNLRYPSAENGPGSLPSRLRAVTSAPRLTSNLTTFACCFRNAEYAGLSEKCIFDFDARCSGVHPFSCPPH
jgi:hypothetical protein